MDFKNVYAINVNDFTEKKNNLTYLSWANAWKAFVEVYPKATYKIVKDEQGKTYFGNSEDGYMVYTSVTVEDLTHEMWLPVMDFKNKSMMNPTTFDVNKAIMRCLTKNLAMFGLGLYIYAGEDIPNEQDQDRIEEKKMKESVKVITLQILQDKAKEKGITDAQILAKLNNNTPDKEHIADINLLTQAQLNGIYKLLNK